MQNLGNANMMNASLIWSLIWQHIWLYLLFINAFTFFIYWLDKKLARRRTWRVSELGLLFLALIGGSPAAFFAQIYLRHKNRKISFQIKLWLVVVAQIMLYFRLS